MLTGGVLLLGNREWKEAPALQTAEKGRHEYWICAASEDVARIFLMKLQICKVRSHLAYKTLSHFQLLWIGACCWQLLIGVIFHKALIRESCKEERAFSRAEQCWCWCLAKLGRSALCCPVAAATFRKPSFLVSGSKTSARTHQSRSFASYHHFCQLLLLIILAWGLLPLFLIQIVHCCLSLFMVRWSSQKPKYQYRDN